MNKLKVATVATKDDGYLKWLKQSCSRHGTELIILGGNRTWKGFVTKFEIMIEFLNSEDDNTIVCFVDAYDVIMLKSAEDLKQKFLESGSKIICSVSTFPEFGVRAIDDFIKDATRFIFNAGDHLPQLNPGCYMGYVKDLKVMLSGCLEIYIADDEILINRFYAMNPHLITPDVSHDYFHNVPMSDVIDRDDYGSHSFFIHRIYKQPLFNLLRSQGYEISYDEQIEMTIQQTMTSIVRFMGAY